MCNDYFTSEKQAIVSDKILRLRSIIMKNDNTDEELDFLINNLEILIGMLKHDKKTERNYEYYNAVRKLFKK